MKIIIIAGILLSFVLMGDVTASDKTGINVTNDQISHSGRTNKEGCHNDKKKGTYHCH